ncbi:MAG: hypothetical protein KatS3mg110_3644 [Pirellulaceae bacterium]|nr:MAG: hypothetical protein KatS3mg110_3644 [Pirellulaceae bacterium]
MSIFYRTCAAIALLVGVALLTSFTGCAWRCWADRLCPGDCRYCPPPPLPFTDYCPPACSSWKAPAHEADP